MLRQTAVGPTVTHDTKIACRPLFSAQCVISPKHCQKLPTVEERRVVGHFSCGVCMAPLS